MEKAYEIVDGTINGFIWNIVPWFLVLAGIYFGLRTLFVQVRLLPSMLRAVAETPNSSSSALIRSESSSTEMPLSSSIHSSVV